MLIEGPTGTGKELVAQTIRQLSTPDEPLICVNCAAIPAELFESELFGHEAGAFTSARGLRAGLFGRSRQRHRSSTRSASCRWRCNRSCCACSRRGSSGVSAVTACVVECYTKPLDVASMLERLSQTLAQGMRGHVRNISLPSLLQLIEMERKTCTLAAESAGCTGYLYLTDGALIDARMGDLQGDAAAIQIAGWKSSAVTIINTCATKQRTVERPMGFIIMEAVRLMDEASRAPASPREGLELDLGGMDEPPPNAPIQLRSVSHFPVPQLSDNNAFAIVETATGRIRSSAGDFAGLDALAQLVAKIYANEARAVEKMGIDEAFSEIVMTTEKYWTMTRPLKTEPPSLALLVFDPQRGNVVLERIELEAFVHALEEWSSVQAGMS